MPALTLGQAARMTGVGKTTLTRAIKAGKLSAARRDDGSYEIDPSELARVYDVRPETPETVADGVAVVRHETPSETASDPEVTARLAALDAEVAGLKALLSEVRQSRDDWRDQAARLALVKPAEVVTPPVPAPAPEPAPVPLWHALRRRLVG